MFWEFTRPDVKHNPADYVEFSRVAESWLEDDRPYAFTFNVEWYDIKIPCFLENTSSEVCLCHLHKLVKSGAPQRERKRTEFPVSDFKIKHLQLLKGRNPPPAPTSHCCAGYQVEKNPPNILSLFHTHFEFLYKTILSDLNHSLNKLYVAHYKHQFKLNMDILVHSL